jgi:hypothetical protein
MTHNTWQEHGFTLIRPHILQDARRVSHPLITSDFVDIGKAGEALK